jgi:penicillin-binding protein 1A
VQRAADNRPIDPVAFKPDERGWLDWIFKPQRNLGGNQHEMMQDMLAAVVTQGTGRNARLAIPTYGKTGTSQDNRDAFFIGYAGDLVVGVWIGNDDNSSLNNINGGGLPARIWRDFMSDAVKGARPVIKAKPKPKPSPLPDPDGPIEPLDLPEIPEIPIQVGGADVRIDANKGVTVSTEIGGVPLDVTWGRDGVDVKSRDPAPAQ